MSGGSWPTATTVPPGATERRARSNPGRLPEVSKTMAGANSGSSLSASRARAVCVAPTARATPSGGSAMSGLKTWTSADRAPPAAGAGRERGVRRAQGSCDLERALGYVGLEDLDLGRSRPYGDGDEQSDRAGSNHRDSPEQRGGDRCQTLHGVPGDRGGFDQRSRSPSQAVDVDQSVGWHDDAGGEGTRSVRESGGAA